MTQTLPLDRNTADFAETFDVIVVGFGFAGAVAAIEAHDRGARVLLIEKMPDPGGISICAGGGLRYGTDAAAAYEYVKATNEATNGGRTPDDVIRAFAQGIGELKEYLESLAHPVGAKVEEIHRKANYPFPGFESLSFVQIESVPGFDGAREYPHVHGTANFHGTNNSRGILLFKVLHENIRRRGIEVRLATPALRLITGPTGAIRGLWVGGDGGAEGTAGASAILGRSGTPRAIAARRGVILACGGMESALDLQAQYWQGGPVLSAAFRGNTGDHIRMGQDVGAALWHLWHFHGTYGFRHHDPAFPFGIRAKRLPDWTPGASEPTVPMSWILLDRRGQRFMNEYPPYFQDTGARALELVDTVRQAPAYKPAFLVVDDDGRQRYALGHVVFNDRDTPHYVWSGDNLREVGNGMLRQAHSIEELARIIGAEPARLAATLDRWNAACEQGRDDEHGRPAGSMLPIRKPPFLVGEVWPVVSNTQGGIAHDARQRVLNGYGEAIPGLYVAGEAGSLWGDLYLVGGNLAECFVSGRIAAADIAGV
jgi:succinate dehydrogenase/fumarate reductase flavoprotein subunit